MAGNPINPSDAVLLEPIVIKLQDAIVANNKQMELLNLKLAMILTVMGFIGATVGAWLRVGQGRHFSTEIDQAHQAAFAQPGGIVDTPVPQDVCACGGQVLTAMVHEGALWLARSHEAAWQAMLEGAAVMCNPVCRPGVRATGEQAQVFFYENGSVWAAAVDVEERSVSERVKLASAAAGMHDT